MRRARRWFAAVAVMTLFAGCTTTSDVGGDAFTPEDALWAGAYVAVLVLGVIGARVLLDSNE